MSFLKTVQQHYYLFEPTNGEFPKDFKMPKNVESLFQRLFRVTNNNYERYCADFGIDLYDEPLYIVKKDKAGNCYWEIIGADDKTKLIIIGDTVDIGLYYDIRGYKIRESKFIDYLDKWQKYLVQFSELSPRFINTTPSKIDLCEELNARSLFQILLTNYSKMDNNRYMYGRFEEPENKNGSKRSRKNDPPIERKNEVIPHDQRSAILLSYNPAYRFVYSGNNTGKKVEAYIYNKDGYTLAVVEPYEGLGYQYLLNIGPYVDFNDSVEIYDIIKTILETPEEIILLDDAIIRKNHTTIDNFKDNLDVFINNARSSKSIYSECKVAQNVYGKK